MRSATRVLVSTFGSLVAIAGIEHGIGEALQGSAAPSGVAILSWPGAGPFEVLGGEPAMTLVPNLLATGMLAILVSVAFLAWATLFIERSHGALVLMLLCIPLLLFGGGFGPPILGAILAAAATRINSPLAWWRSHLGCGARRTLAAVWPCLFAICLIVWLLMFPGLVLLNLFAGVSDTDLVVVLAAGMPGFLLVTMIAGFARDAERHELRDASAGVARRPVLAIP